MKRYLKGLRVEGLTTKVYNDHYDYSTNRLEGEMIIFNEVEIKVDSDCRDNYIMICDGKYITADFLEVFYEPNEKVGAVRKRLINAIKYTKAYQKYQTKLKLIDFLNQQ